MNPQYKLIFGACKGDIVTLAKDTSYNGIIVDFVPESGDAIIVWTKQGDKYFQFQVATDLDYQPLNKLIILNS